MDELNAYDRDRLEKIKQQLEKIERQGANAYWDDVPSHENPFICGDIAKKGFEYEFQAWIDGWNQSDREVCHG